MPIYLYDKEKDQRLGIFNNTFYGENGTYIISDDLMPHILNQLYLVSQKKIYSVKYNIKKDNDYNIEIDFLFQSKDDVVLASFYNDKTNDFDLYLFKCSDIQEAYKTWFEVYCLR
ncbi:MAG: hypothetical protein KatS3mg002_0407 [Candidatus Woesearchaeota archaeon]|nr:MAG: hypothetical protein KatS3mg002_0407 [Candidatus Woesearchaeota archaeon]